MPILERTIASVERDSQSTSDRLAASLAIRQPIAEFNYLSHISLKNKYLYWETPKVACTFIKSFLNLVERTNVYYHWKCPDDPHAREGSLLFMPDHLPFALANAVFNGEDYYRFSFTRNPFERLLSAYISHFVIVPGVIRDIFLSRYNLPIYETVSFGLFIEKITMDDPDTLDVHWRPLANLLNVGKVRFDFIGRFENLSTDIFVVLRTIAPWIDQQRAQELYNEVGPRGVKTHANHLVPRFYTKRLLEQVKLFYKEDFLTFLY